MASSAESNEPDVDPENLLKILVATDIHLGFAEKDPIRGPDSFVTFEEILQLAVKNDVDFILLGGDLFHENKPSPYCMNKCLELIKRYCMGDRPVCMELLSDTSYNFPSLINPIVNYEDPNLNISIPIFSINGNHDDPTGQKHISAMNVLASTGLINYFGRWNDLSQVTIRPILMKKGETKLALYGLSHIKDERLCRLFRDNKVLINKVQDSTDSEWFHMMVLHQNRAMRSAKNFVPETSLPKFMSLIIWGHEHDCRIVPERVVYGPDDGDEPDCYISQPGSSVATSLSAGEALPKKVGLLKICGNKFKMVPLSLTTVRPFVIDELVLESPSSGNFDVNNPSEQAIRQTKDKVESMLVEAANTSQDGVNHLPLIRLKVFYHLEEQQFNMVRFGMQFTYKVANPDTMVKINSLQSNARRQNTDLNLDEDHFENFVNINEWATNVEDIVTKLFEEEKNANAMTVLSAKGLTDAVTRFVKLNDLESMASIVESQFKKTLDELQNMNPEIDKIEDAIQALKMQRLKGNQISVAMLFEDETNPISTSNVANSVVQVVLSSEDEEVSMVSAVTSKRGTPKARGTTRGRRGGSRGRRGTMDSYLSLA